MRISPHYYLKENTEEKWHRIGTSWWEAREKWTKIYRCYTLTNPVKNTVSYLFHRWETQLHRNDILPKITHLTSLTPLCHACVPSLPSLQLMTSSSFRKQNSHIGTLSLISLPPVPKSICIYNHILSSFLLKWMKHPCTCQKNPSTHALDPIHPSACIRTPPACGLKL